MISLTTLLENIRVSLSKGVGFALSDLFKGLFSALQREGQERRQGDEDTTSNGEAQST